MKVCGIIAEYNPFHSGHAYQIAQARTASDCDFVLVVMSGDFVQRGAPAVADKYLRARLALMQGADLVLMLPAYASTSSAEGFAQAGISALHTTGIVNSISFGCEQPDICSEHYQALAQALTTESDAFQKELSRQLSTGISYAQARILAIRSCFDTADDLTLLDTPNNLLAFEYLRACAHLHADFDLYPIRRLGNYHDSQLIGSPDNGLPHQSAPASYASASACRRLMLADDFGGLQRLEGTQQLSKDACRLLYDYANAYAFLQEDDVSAMLHYALLTQKSQGFSSYLDCSTDLSARICQQLENYQSFSQFCDLLKNKSVSRSRLARVLTHILLCFPTFMHTPLIANNGTLPYLRVLGFRKTAQPLLHALKKHADAPIITRVAQAQRMLSEDAMEYFKQDLRTAEIYRSLLFHKCGQRYPDDYRRTIEIV